MNYPAKDFLGPLLAQIALTYLTAGGILVTRLVDIVCNGAKARFYEDYEGGGPPFVRRTTSQLANLFEFPVLFFAVITLAVAANQIDTRLVVLAWTYTILRWAHAVVRLTPTLNRLWLRTPVFVLSNLVLLSMWLALSVNVFNQA